MVRLFFASTQFFPTHPFSGVTARQSVAYPYVLAFQGCRQVVGYFAAKSAVRFNRLLAFLRVEPFCFSGGVIFFYWKQVQWLYACVVMFSPQNPQVCSSVAAFHFIVQSLFSIRGILYASFFGFIFLKGIAEVSSGVSIGGRPYFRNVPCFLSDRLFFCILSKPVADFQVLSFSYHFLVKSNHFPLQIQIVANPGYGDKGAIHKHHVVIRLKSSFFRLA